MTVVAVHQPNFCPWLGFFVKLARSDAFVLLDTVQFAKRSWINRVRIKTHQGAAWLAVPVRSRGRYDQRIADVEIAEDEDWRKKLLRTLESNYARAPHFAAHFPEVSRVVAESGTSLCELNVALLRSLMGTLGIETRLVRAAELPAEGKATDLLISLVKAAGGKAYLSGDGAGGYQEDEKFAAAGLRLLKNEFRHPVYDQLWGEFVPGLSVLDALFNLGAGATAELCRPARPTT